MQSEVLDRREVEAGDLLESHPPRWQHPNKQAVYDWIRASKDPCSGRLVYVRWCAQPLPPTLTRRQPLQVHPGLFTYPVRSAVSEVDWHMNFADPNLFVAYGSCLLAQDELQVLEHPILGSLREALTHTQSAATTMDAQGQPTPITISGVQRRCAIDTRRDPEAGRPWGLYGNAFAEASMSEVRVATRLVEPPTVSNIVAISAPIGGEGDYSRADILYIATAAYTGFLAARRESERIAGTAGKIRIHTGFWGCGVFGGNRILMTVLQALAADLAGVGLEFHAVDEAGASLAQVAYERYARMAGATASVATFLEALAAEKFQWGVSDGN